MRSTSWIILLLCAGCTAHFAPTVTASKVTASPSLKASPSPAPAPAQAAEASKPPEKTSEAVTQVVEPNDAAIAASEGPTASGEEEAAADDEPADAVDTDEGEAQEVDPNAVPTGPLYTADLSDEELTARWKKDPKSLGSISVGFVESGRMVNSVRVPESNDWIVVSPELAWTTQETLDYLTRAIREVRAQYPKSPPIRVNQISARDGGYLRPHKSHQNGRDVDLGFYYPTAEPIRAREREKYIDLELNWALVKALAMHADVQMILVDKRVQKVLYDYALRKGENKEWLDSLFNAGTKSLLKHARGHRDHFHVRFYNPRAQELGRRIAPLLAMQPDQNIMMHRVHSGDTLGGIALRYGSSVQAIKKSNRMRSILLRIGQVLAVPLRGPCNHCPVPPPVVVPPRRMPPEAEQAPALATKQAPATAPQPAPAVAPAPAAPTTSEQPAATAQQAPAAAQPSAPEAAPSPAQQPAVATQAVPATPAEEKQPATVTLSAPATLVEKQPAVATQQAPAPVVKSQPAVSSQQEHTGGSAPVSAETSAEKPLQTPDATQKEPSGMHLPVSTHTSASIVMPPLVR